MAQGAGKIGPSGWTGSRLSESTTSCCQQQIYIFSSLKYFETAKTYSLDSAMNCVLLLPILVFAVLISSADPARWPHFFDIWSPGNLWEKIFSLIFQPIKILYVCWWLTFSFLGRQNQDFWMPSSSQPPCSEQGDNNNNNQEFLVAWRLARGSSGYLSTVSSSKRYHWCW